MSGTLEIHGLAKTFSRRGQSVEALRDITLRVNDGEFVTVLGPSGCGKSTMLHIVGGFERPTAGTVLLNDRAVTSPGRDRGMVFQQPTLFPWKTVLRNVSWTYEVARVSKATAAARARDLLELVGLEGFAEAYPGELSGGMRQRVALARTLALEPDVLLMDEPFGALDAQTREGMQEELLRIWQESGVTVAFVTHDINEAIFLGDRVVVMSARPGRIIQDVALDFPRPRTPDIKKQARFFEYHNLLWDVLREEQDSIPSPAGDEPAAVAGP